MADRLPRVQHSRQPQDTAGWCVERAQADRIAAAATDNDNVRLRHELSAASWLARAEMLQRIDDSIRSRSEAACASEPRSDAERDVSHGPPTTSSDG